MLTVEEYMFLRSMMDGPVSRQEDTPIVAPPKKSRRRRKSAYNKHMSKVLKDLNKRYKTKSGEYRKGFDSARIIQMAHKQVRRMKK